MKKLHYKELITVARLKALFGMAGVPHGESIAAQHLVEVFYWGMLLIVFWLPIQWYLEIRHVLLVRISEVSDWVIWGAFMFETISLFVIVKHKVKYLVSNWMNLVVIFLGFPFIWIYFPELTNIRLLRLLLLISIIVPWVPLGFNFLARNRLGATLIIAVIVTFLSGMLISTFDSGIKDPLSGIWWAWQTVTTASYGDIVPTSWEGKVVAIIIMIMGGGLFSLLTANISAFLIKHNQNENIVRSDKILAVLEQLSERVAKLEEKIEQISPKRKN